MRFLLAASLALFACKHDHPATATAPMPPTGSATEGPPSTDQSCGMKTSDWCPSPPGDACGAHKSKDECKADPACRGMKYTGESLVACEDDGTGFSKNCPTVGCVSR